MKDIPRYYTDQEILHAALILLIFAAFSVGIWKKYFTDGFNYVKAWFRRKRETRIERCDHAFPQQEAMCADLSDLPYLKCLKCNSPLGEVTGGKI